MYTLSGGRASGLAIWLFDRSSPGTYRNRRRDARFIETVDVGYDCCHIRATSRNCDAGETHCTWVVRTAARAATIDVMPESTDPPFRHLEIPPTNVVANVGNALPHKFIEQAAIVVADCRARRHAVHLDALNIGCPFALRQW